MTETKTADPLADVKERMLVAIREGGASASTWLALADRCEKATGEDRDIDRCIHIYSMSGDLIVADNYTTSLDAIVALVEAQIAGASRQSGFVNRYQCDSDDVPGGWARIFDPQFLDDEDESRCVVGAATECLAYCASFCRAMSARAAEKEGT